MQRLLEYEEENGDEMKEKEAGVQSGDGKGDGDESSSVKRGGEW